MRRAFSDGRGRTSHVRDAGRHRFRVSVPQRGACARACCGRARGATARCASRVSGRRPPPTAAAGPRAGGRGAAARSPSSARGRPDAGRSWARSAATLRKLCRGAGREALPCLTSLRAGSWRARSPILTRCPHARGLRALRTSHRTVVTSRVGASCSSRYRAAVPQSPHRHAERFEERAADGAALRGF